VVYVRLDDLLPPVRAAVEAARSTTGWDPALLRAAISREFDFLGPYTDAVVVSGTEADARTAAMAAAVGEGWGSGSPAAPGTPPAGGEEWLVARFTPPGAGRDLVGAERAFQRATGKADRGDVKAAVRELEQVARSVPEVAKYHRALGQSYLVLGRLDDAEDSFLRALRLDPRNSDALTLLGNLYAQRGRHADAVPLYERSLAVGRNVYALNNLAAALARQGRREEAVRLFRQAVAEDPSYPNAHYGLALALSQARDVALLPEAIGELDAALAALGDRRRDPAVWDAARGLLDQLSALAAEQEATVAAGAARAYVVERETAAPGAGDVAIPVRVEQARLDGGAGEDRVRVGPRAPLPPAAGGGADDPGARPSARAPRPARAGAPASRGARAGCRHQSVVRDERGHPGAGRALAALRRGAPPQEGPRRARRAALPRFGHRG
jgi:cytochrome c-type biogenesis protein CcmH/NrfG